MRHTEIIEQVHEGFMDIIHQIKTKNTIDTDIMALSKKLDLLLEQCMNDQYAKQKGKAT